MDGDQPDLIALAKLATANNARLIIDEAHALGITKSGFVASLGLQDKVFATVVTFGKALGCHGAAILGSEHLKTYLTNFARSLIYSTALPPQSIAVINASYWFMNSEAGTDRIQVLKRNIRLLRSLIDQHQLAGLFIHSETAIQSFVVGGNQKVKEAAARLAVEGFDVRPILSPTVAGGSERLRICLHSFNTEADIERLVICLAKLKL
jgi:8-amino-7-oxononanoate synthase